MTFSSLKGRIFGSESSDAKFGFWQMVLVLVLLAALAVGVYLVQRQQTYKSEAANSWVNAFEIKDSKGNVLTCDSTTNPPTCTSPSLNVTIRIKDKDALIK